MPLVAPPPSLSPFDGSQARTELVTMVDADLVLSSGFVEGLARDTKRQVLSQC